MYRLPYTDANWESYLRQHRQSHRMTTVVELLDRNENSRAIWEGIVIEGDVAFDATANITRSLKLKLLDPDHRLYLDPDSPSAAGLFVGQMVQVYRDTYVDSLNEWVRAPVFRGPIARFEREGAVLDIEAVGKEALMLAPRLMWETVTGRKGARLYSVIRTLLYNNGERRFRFPALGTGPTLPKDRSWAYNEEAWTAAKQLAQAANRHLFYDGAGYATLRGFSRSPMWNFSAVTRGAAEPPDVVTEPRVTLDFFEFRNTVEVLGPEPTQPKKGTKKPKRIRAVVNIANADPLSPRKLARNGDNAHYVEVIENENIKRSEQARQLAQRIAARRGRLTIDVEFEALPVPVLEEHDWVRLFLADDVLTFPLTRWTLPLHEAAPMTIGGLTQQRVRRARPRRRRRR